MSKAFTKEPDDEDRDDEEVPENSVPRGEKNYLTPAGAARLQAELHDLLHKQRPEITAVVAWAASNGDRSENADYIYGKRRLRELDRRIRFLTKRLEAAEIVDPLQVKSEQVFFGATVTVEDEEGERKTYSIVGIDEADPARGKISWISPLTRALLKARVGDLVQFRSPKGIRELEVVEILYREIL
ncbi:transcription elongation factor GreB [bacterium]|nr:MAG: transcription elongation factor GreB [bacterium]